MAILSEAKRKKYFDVLGLGEYNDTNLRKLQKKYMRPQDVDGVYGSDTDKLLRHLYNVRKCAPSFKPTEFRCTCGHCTGYPSYMKQVELKHLQKIRDHYKKPMKVTSGLRCNHENARSGGVKNSGHLHGYAADFYMQGVTDTVASRTKSLEWIKKQPDHKFTYGANMKDSDGQYRAASGMGNAMHTETHKPAMTKQEKMCSWARKIAADESYHYVKYSMGAKAHECPICHDHSKGAYYGWNCIGFAWASWRHGAGIKCRCSCDAMTDQLYEKILKASAKDALKLVQDRLHVKDIQVIRSRDGIAPSKLRKGDIVAYFNGNNYIHTALWLGDGLIADCTSGRKDNIKYGVRSYDRWKLKLAFRYIGK